LVISVSFKQCC